MNEECPYCKGTMELQCSFEEYYLKKYVYWWECMDCNRIYDYQKRNLLFIEDK